jgi:hypothetical protein
MKKKIIGNKLLSHKLQTKLKTLIFLMKQYILYRYRNSSTNFYQLIRLTIYQDIWFY